MRHSTTRIATSTLLCLLIMSAAHAELWFSLKLNGGYYMLPDQVSGLVENLDYYAAPEDNAYIQPDPSSSGYSETTYHFSHPFDKRVLPNIGFGINLGYVIPSGYLFGFELGYGFSVNDYSVTSTTTDSLGRDASSVIPHDYRIDRTESGNMTYVKHLTVGAAFGKRLALSTRSDLLIALGLGKADYLARFQIDNTAQTMQYYQSNGHLVYEDEFGGSFEVFGILYTSLYLRPRLGWSFAFTPLVSLDSEVSIPLSYIEKGSSWSDEGNNGSAAFYPSGRLVAGNAIVSLGLGIHLGRR